MEDTFCKLRELAKAADTAVEVEAGTVDRLKIATQARAMAVQELNEALLLSLEIKVGESVVEVPHRFFRHENRGVCEFVLVTKASHETIGIALGRVVDEEGDRGDWTPTAFKIDEARPIDSE